MATFYNKSRKYLLSKIDFKVISADLENDFNNPESPALKSFEDAYTWYEMLLDNAGKIAAEYIAPRAEAVDEVGAVHIDGTVHWADETKENMQMLAKAGYMGGTISRKFGGLNLPQTVNTIIIEMVSQADASLMNLFGLQDIAVIVEKYGNKDQKERVLPKFCTGKISGSMALTEPDAGSDLQAVNIKAIEKDGQWYLDGVKRFITNGSGDVSLVLARSEEGSKGGRGLSMFLYERYLDDNMIVRRIENKLGIKGSPTCELQFNMAKCELVGKRKFGLIKYVMALMNGARLGVSSQALGIAQAAYEEAVKYAGEREQFGKNINEFPAVYQMLKKMKAEIETGRLLLYRTSFAVDMQEMLERKAHKGEDVKQELRDAKALADFLTPLAKYMLTEMANKITYDTIQIHGGVGYMKDFPAERLARDARITNIYEGTTQLQVVAAIGGITNNILGNDWKAFEAADYSGLEKEKETILDHIDVMQKISRQIKELKSKELHDYTATYLVEMASLLYRLVHFMPLAVENDENKELFRYFYLESTARLEYLENISLKYFEEYGDSISILKEGL